MRNRFLLGAIFGLVILGTVWYFFFAAAQSSETNILLVTFDTTRADHIGCYGDADAFTPALDRLAAKGVLFERAYATAPLTLPSHATILTGLVPPEHGLRVNGKNALDEEIPTLAEILGQRGYSTSAFIAAFVLDSTFGLNRGFDLYDDDLSNSPDADHPLHRSRPGAEVTDRALNWIDEQGSRPFFCWVHLYDPHHPYVDHRDRFGNRFSDRPYDAEIAYADAQLERLLEKLAERGIDRNTIVIAVGDHGEGLDDHNEHTHSNMVYNSTMHVPLIVSLPERFASGRREAAVVSLTDIMPTILDVLNIEHARPSYSRSLRPALEGTSMTNGVCYGESQEPFVENGWSPLQSLTTETWKYIRTTRPELYDLSNDAAELDNLAASRPEQLDAMEKQLADLEATFVDRAAVPVHLSNDERRVLESLGYAGGGTESEIREDDERSLPDIKDMIEYYNRLVQAQDFIHRRDFDAAIKILHDIVEQAPDYARAHGLLGVCMAELGKYGEAEQRYLKVLELGRDVESALLNLGLLAKQQKKTDEAIRHFTALLQIHPQSADAHFYLAGIYENQGRTSRDVELLKSAVDHYETVTRLRPDHLDATARLAWILSTSEFETLRDGRRALSLAMHACELTQFHFPPALDVLAAAYAETGQYAEAIRRLEQCLKLPGVAANSDFVRDVQLRLGAYRKETPWREP